MNNELENYILESNKEQLEFLLCFYEAIKNLEDDPISMEIQLDSILLICQQNNFNFSEKFLLDFAKSINVINYDPQIKLVRLFPEDYKKIMDILNNQKEIIFRKITDYKNVFKIANNHKHDEKKLINILKEMYDNAPNGYQMTMVHLFGIKYAKQLKGKKIKNIAIAATGKESLYVEIGKGIKLANYVKLLI